MWSIDLYKMNICNAEYIEVTLELWNILLPKVNIMTFYNIHGQFRHRSWHKEENDESSVQVKKGNIKNRSCYFRFGMVSRAFQLVIDITRSFQILEVFREIVDVYKLYETLSAILKFSLKKVFSSLWRLQYIVLPFLDSMLRC